MAKKSKKDLLEIMPKELTAWKPKNMQDVIEFAIAMVTHARLDTTLTFTEFYSLRGLLNDEVNALGAQHPLIARAILLSKQIISDRREIGAMNGDLDRTVVMATLPLYHKEFAKYRVDMLRHQAMISANAQTQQRVVVIEKMPDSKLVPMKK